MTVGIDEVGRGCWAGPLVAGAVALRAPIAGLADSKVLTAARRRQLDTVIRAEAAGFGLGWVSADELDDVGLTEAVRLAMYRAYEDLMGGCAEAISEIIVDGSFNYFADDPRAKAVVKADGTVPAASAASIIAKVARDVWMAQEASRRFPQYQFEKHVGYGTALHRQLLERHGVSVLHRRSFRPIRELLECAR